MMTSFHQVAFTLSVMIIIINVTLYAGGMMALSDVSKISFAIANIPFDKMGTSGFQQSLDITTASSANDSFLATILDFVSSIPVVGQVVNFFNFLYQIIFTLAFGVSILLFKMQIPLAIDIPIIAVFFIIQYVGLYEHIIGFIWSGSSRK